MTSQPLSDEASPRTGEHEEPRSPHLAGLRPRPRYTAETIPLGRQVEPRLWPSMTVRFWIAIGLVAFWMTLKFMGIHVMGFLLMAALLLQMSGRSSTEPGAPRRAWPKNLIALALIAATFGVEWWIFHNWTPTEMDALSKTGAYTAAVGVACFALLLLQRARNKRISAVAKD